MEMNPVLFHLIALGIELVKMYLFCFPLFRQHTRPLKITLPTITAGTVIYIVLAMINSDKASLYRWIIVPICFIIADSKFSRMISLLAYPVVSMLDMTAALPVLFLFNISTNEMSDNSVMKLFSNMISIPFLLLLVMLVRVAANKRRHLQIRGKLVVPVILFLITIGTLETAAFSIAKTLPANYRMTVLFSLLAANMLSLVLCVWILRSDSDNLLLTQESQIMQKQMEMQKQHYTRLMEKSEELRSFRHDIRNHIYCMRVLLDEGNLEELKSYMDSMDVMVHSVGHSIKSGNKLLDAIIGEQMHKYPEVKVEFAGSYPEQSMLSDVDFCTIFFNALSNAFEAAVQTEAKTVSLHVRTLETHLLFSVSNSAAAAPQIRHNRFISTKSEAGHGYGMSNMIDCLKRNQLQYDTEFLDGIYTLNIYFMNALAPFTAKN